MSTTPYSDLMQQPGRRHLLDLTEVYANIFDRHVFENFEQQQKGDRRKSLIFNSAIHRAFEEYQRMGEQTPLLHPSEKERTTTFNDVIDLTTSRVVEKLAYMGLLNHLSRLDLMIERICEDGRVVLRELSDKE
jgi:hypothetical protein